MPIRASDPFADPSRLVKKAVNPYVAQMIAAQADSSLPLAFGPSLRQLAHSWLAHFTGRLGTTPQQLILEIGCHNGDCLTALAQDNPATAFVGIDITFKRIMQTARKLQTSGVNNALSVLANASGLKQLFAAQELDGVVVFFPDPWSKKARQAKHRLLQKAFLDELRQCLKPDGFIWIKTDQFRYYAEICSALKELGFAPGNLPLGWVTRPYISRFERHFQEQKTPYFAGVWVRSPTARQ